jgi:deoxyribodipyrimidine photo-lyase
VPSINIFWFRRDLRLEDNSGLFNALKSGKPVLPVFIFDKNILDELNDRYDKRVAFIHHRISILHEELEKIGSGLLVYNGYPIEIFKKLVEENNIHTVFTNNDYEPYAVQRDDQIKRYLLSKEVGFKSYKDHVIFEKDEILKDDGTCYSIFTPYARKWMSRISEMEVKPSYLSIPLNFVRGTPCTIPSLKEIGFEKADITFEDPIIDENIISIYHQTRNFPAVKGTSRMGIHLRFGTISIRTIVRKALSLNQSFLNELIWREFFIQMLWREPRLVLESCKKQYDNIVWRNNESEFKRWTTGTTGYPIVDAGMRELNETGFMHNRVRMITASFLVKHLLIDWRWGESYFAQKLLDYELASNVGNWQWVAGCGCDAAPYFRIFNPVLQTKKFDPQLVYIKKWVPELYSLSYPRPVVIHEMARLRCLQVFKNAIVQSKV